MSIAIPDYDIAETAEIATPAQLRAYADPLRITLLDLVLERAATVAELAEAVGRPKSTVAHHVGVLVDIGLMRVVRTRQGRTRRPDCPSSPRFLGGLPVSLPNGAVRRPDPTGTAPRQHARTPSPTVPVWDRAGSLRRASDRLGYVEVNLFRAASPTTCEHQRLVPSAR